MKRSKKNKLLPVIIIAIAASAGAAAALPSLKQRFAAAPPASRAVASEPVNETELAVLQELGSLFHRLDSVADFEVKGSVLSSDPQDSTSAQAFTYHYARRDSMVYYRLGEQEMLSTDAVFVMANHATEQLFVSAPKPFNPGIFPAGEQMANFLTGEGYEVGRTKKSGLNWITLKRPNHITCKEYRVGFDDAGFIRETFMRLTDLSDPLNTEKDKTMLMKADQWKIESPAASLFDASRFIQRQSGKFLAAGSFKTYQLILTQ